MNSIFLQWHLGLGDAIICNGLVRELAKRYERVYVPSKTEKLASIFWMLGDLENVTVVPVKDDSEMNIIASQHPSLGLGLWSVGGLKDWAHWDRQFYTDAGVPFDARWSSFKVPECSQVKPPDYEYAFTHQEFKRGMAIRKTTNLPVYEPPTPPHIFWNLEALRRATEIHVVNSCFLNLAESVPTTARRLVVHAYARKDRAGLPTLRKNWEVL